jgi:hypothetical protein
VFGVDLNTHINTNIHLHTNFKLNQAVVLVCKHPVLMDCYPTCPSLKLVFGVNLTPIATPGVDLKPQLVFILGNLKGFSIGVNTKPLAVGEKLRK